MSSTFRAYKGCSFLNLSISDMTSGSSNNLNNLPVNSNNSRRDKNRTQKETEMQELQASLSLKKGRYVLHITYYIYVLDTYYKLYCNNHIIKHDINYNNESNTSNSKTTTETIPIPTIPIQTPSTATIETAKQPQKQYLYKHPQHQL